MTGCGIHAHELSTQQFCSRCKRMYSHWDKTRRRGLGAVCGWGIRDMIRTAHALGAAGWPSGYCAAQGNPYKQRNPSSSKCPWVTIYYPLVLALKHTFVLTSFSVIICTILVSLTYTKTLSSAAKQKSRRSTFQTNTNYVSVNWPARLEQLVNNFPKGRHTWTGRTGLPLWPCKR